MFGKNTNNVWRFNAKKSYWIANLAAAVAAAIEPDRHLTVSAIVQAKGASEKTIHLILSEDLGLVKKFTHWGVAAAVIRAKKEKEPTSQAMIKLFLRRGSHSWAKR